LRGRDHAHGDISDEYACFDYTSPTDVQILAGPADLDGGEVVSGFHVPFTGSSRTTRTWAHTHWEEPRTT